jgi:hypothetical protein
VLRLHGIRVRRVYWALWAVHLLLLVLMLMMLLLLMLLRHWRYGWTLPRVLHRRGRRLLRRTWTIVVLRLLQRHLLIVRDR